MGAMPRNAYRDAFESATIRLHQLTEEFEWLQRRKAALTNATRALDAMIKSRDATSSRNIEMANAANGDSGTDLRPIEPFTQVYVHGGENAENELERRINLAIG